MFMRGNTSKDTKLRTNAISYSVNKAVYKYTAKSVDN